MSDPIDLGIAIVAAVASIGSTIAAALSARWSLAAVNTMKSQTSEMQRSTHAGAFKSVFDILQAEEVREARRIIIRNMTELSKMPQEEYAGWLTMRKPQADKVMYTYDAVGVMLQNKMLPADIVIDHWGDSIEKCWDALERFVEHERNTRDAQELYDDFEWLAQQVKAKKKRIISE